jgi:hypothetical protein
MFPNIISMEAHNFFKFSPYNAIEDVRHHEFTITLSQIQADMRDVAVYFRKKTGLIKLRDSGLADVILGGQGLSVIIHLVSSDKDRSSVFKVKDVHVKVDSLKFSIRDAKHEFWYKTLKGIATSVVKKQIQKAVGQGIRTGLEYLDGQLVTVRDRMEEAKTNEEMSRRQALQDVRCSFSSAQVQPCLPSEFSSSNTSRRRKRLRQSRRQRARLISRLSIISVLR